MKRMVGVAMCVWLGAHGADELGVRADGGRGGGLQGDAE